MEAGCDCSWLRCGCCASVSGELVSTALRVFCCGLRMLARAMCLHSHLRNMCAMVAAVAAVQAAWQHLRWSTSWLVWIQTWTVLVLVAQQKSRARESDVPETVRPWHQLHEQALIWPVLAARILMWTSC